MHGDEAAKAGAHDGVTVYDACSNVSAFSRDSARVGEARPEWFILGKAHADRARQFKPFAALRGYHDMVDGIVEAEDVP